MSSNVEERKLAIEVIAQLVHIKNIMAAHILEPASIKSEVYKPILYKKDDVTGKVLSKRQIAPLIIEAAEKRDSKHNYIYNLLKIAADWNKFELADDEMMARAIVQKAREVLGEKEKRDAVERASYERLRKEREEKEKSERRETIQRQSSLLLMAFDSLAANPNANERGRLLEEFLIRFCNVYEIPVHQAFTRNQGAEQIDGMISLNGWFYLVECRWRKKPSDSKELDALIGKVSRSTKQMMGIFISINRWSSHVEQILKQNPEKAIILVDGFDIRKTLEGQVDFREFLMKKIEHLNKNTEPYLSFEDFQGRQS
jgi:hypothetical protein